jgi:hypothetical protein
MSHSFYAAGWSPMPAITHDMVTRIMRDGYNPRIPEPVHVPLEDLPRVLATGLVEGVDFSREEIGGNTFLLARSPVGRRWLRPVEPCSLLFSPSRRFIPLGDHWLNDPLLVALYKVGASENEVIVELGKQRDELASQLQRSLMSASPVAIPIPKP